MIILFLVIIKTYFLLKKKKRLRRGEFFTKDYVEQLRAIHIQEKAELESKLNMLQSEFEELKNRKILEDGKERKRLTRKV